MFGFSIRGNTAKSINRILAHYNSFFLVCNIGLNSLSTSLSAFSHRSNDNQKNVWLLWVNITNFCMLFSCQLIPHRTLFCSHVARSRPRQILGHRYVWISCTSQHTYIPANLRNLNCHINRWTRAPNGAEIAPTPRIPSTRLSINWTGSWRLTLIALNWGRLDAFVSDGSLKTPRKSLSLGPGCRIGGLGPSTALSNMLITLQATMLRGFPSNPCCLLPLAMCVCDCNAFGSFISVRDLCRLENI